MQMTENRTHWKSGKENVTLAIAWGAIFLVVGTVLGLAVGFPALGSVGAVAGVAFGSFLAWKNYPDLPVNRRHD